jgi:hypothetical protein
LKQLYLSSGIERLAMALYQLWLVIECIDLAGGPGHEELDDSPGSGAMMKTAVQLRPAFAFFRAKQAVMAQQMSQRNAAKAAGCAPEKLPAIKGSRAHEFHSVNKHKLIRI